MNKMKKILVFSLAALLLVAVGVGGTMAYLTSKPDAVVNTFTAADIKITLSETSNDAADIDKDGKKDEWVAQLIPSKKYAKDPVVEVDLDETTIPIFVYFQVTNDAADYINFDLNATGWTELTAYPGVYYRAWDPAANKDDYKWYLLKGEGDSEFKNGYVQIKQDLTEAETSNVAKDAVKLTFKAYAIQQEGFSAETGWVEVSR